MENTDNIDAWEKGPRTVTLTNWEWNDLSFYIRLTTKYRENERDTWLRLAEERNPDGSPKYNNAADNAAFWQETIDTLDKIVRKLDGM